MLGKQAENQVRFEWMLQNGQVEDHVLAEALAREFFIPLQQMVMTLVDGPGAARPVVMETIRLAVEQRHLYTGEVPLKVWLFALACRRLRRASGFSLSLGITEHAQAHLPLFLRYAQGLAVQEIGRVMGMREKKAARWLETSRRKMLETWGQLPGRPDLPLGHGRNAALLQDALDGILDPDTATGLDAHLEGCSACKIFADGLAERETRFRQMAQAAWPQQQLPQGELDAIQRDLVELLSQKSLRRRFSLSAKELSLSLLVIGIVAWLGWSGGMFKPQPDLATLRARNRVRPYRSITITPHRAHPTPLPASPEPSWSDYQDHESGTGVIDSPNGVLIPFGDYSAAGLGYISDGRWSSTGPVSLTSVLQYWGSKVNPVFAVKWLRPDSRDENVMPYELVDFAEARSRLRVVYRIGGNLELLRQLTRAGFPVIVQRGGLLPGNGGWIGRYQVVLGYENNQDTLAVQVNFSAEGSELVRGEVFEREWRAFNYAFLLLYPPEKEELALSILGDMAGEEDSARIAAQIASEEIYTTNGQDQFFAWFNRGSSLVALDDYGGAAQAFDEAFTVYGALSENQRPWRILWYQTRPYWAYYYTARYRDLINLATQTLAAMEDPVLEESYYWRALAREALGDKKGAIADLEAAVQVNPHFTVGLEQLRRLTEET